MSILKCIINLYAASFNFKEEKVWIIYKYKNNNNESCEFESQPECNNNKPGTPW